MRRPLVTLALALLPAAAARAQSLEERLEEKLKKPFVANAAWVVDFGEAKKQAREGRKVIFAYFTRSFAP